LHCLDRTYRKVTDIHISLNSLKKTTFTKGNRWELVNVLSLIIHPTSVTMEFPVMDKGFGASQRNSPSESGKLSLMGGNREKASRRAPEQLKDVQA